MSHTRPRQHSGQTWDTREGINSGRPIANLPRKIPNDKKIWIVHRNLWKETKMGKEKFKNFQTRSLFKYGHSFSWALQDTKPRLRWGASLGEKINGRRPNDWGWTSYWDSVVFANEKCACLIAPRQIRNWFELVVEGEELKTRCRHRKQKSLILVLYIKKSQKFWCTPLLVMFALITQLHSLHTNRRI